jgi:hypothetical protein
VPQLIASVRWLLCPAILRLRDDVYVQCVRFSFSRDHTEALVPAPTPHLGLRCPHTAKWKWVFTRLRVGVHGTVRHQDVIFCSAEFAGGCPIPN